MTINRLTRGVRMQMKALANNVWSKLRYILYCQQLGADWREKASVTWFVLKSAIAYRFPFAFRRNDVAIRVQGVTYTVGLRSGEFFIFEEIYHDRIYDRIGDFVPQADWTVFDIGANVGLFAVHQARRGARVYAFEPNPDCYRRLSKTITQNNLTGMIRPFNDAVGFQIGSGVLTVPVVSMMIPTAMNSTVSGSIMPIVDYPGAHTFTVAMTSLDQMIPSLNISHIDLLKIDVEGAEMEVLRGAGNVLGMVDRIIIEYHSHDLRDQVGGFLQSQQFSLVLQMDSKSALEAGLLYYAKSS